MHKANFELIYAYLNNCRNRARFLTRWASALVICCGLLAEVSSAQEDQLLPPGTYRLENDHGVDNPSAGLWDLEVGIEVSFSS